MALAATWGIGGEAEAEAAATGAAAAPAPAPRPAVDDGREFRLFPLFEHARQDDGKHRTWVLGLFHRTSAPDGSTWSYHVGPWVSSPALTAVAPLYWRFGAAGATHTWVLPVWLHGPRYTAVPPLLSATWRRAGGGRALWVTPLLHVNTDAAGRLDDLHVLTWFQGDRHLVALPVVYAYGAPGQRRVGVIPAWFSGPGWWTVPLALSGGWRRSDGGRSDWFTPLAHVDRDAHGAIAGGHLLTWFHGRDRDVVFPLAWWGGQLGKRFGAVLPFAAWGPGYGVVPLGLSAWWRERDGGRTAWITPLAHRRTDADGGVRHAHAGPYLRGRDWHALLPVGYARRTAAGWHHGAPLAYVAGPGYWGVPLALSGRWTNAAGGRTTWVTPLVHASTDGGGAVRSLHVGTYLRGRDWHVAFPLGYAVRSARGWHHGVPAAYVAGPGYWAAPLALTASWRTSVGGRTTWVTPLVHMRTDGDGAVRSLHALTYLRGRDWHVAFPLGYAVRSATGWHHGVPAAYVAGPGYWAAPLALTASWRNAIGGRTTWVTPLVHASTDGDGAVRSLHALTYLRGRDWHVAFPLGYAVRSTKGWHHGVPAAYVAGPGYWAVPVGLTASWRNFIGGRTTWVTPLVHMRTDGDGAVRSLHALTYLRGRDWHVAFPLGYAVRSAKGWHHGVPAAYVAGPGYWAVPVGLTASWRNSIDGRTTWVTPLVHARTDGDGAVRSLHALTYVRGRAWHVAFPLGYAVRSAKGWHHGAPLAYVAGPGYWAAPLALTASWRNADGGRTTWATPLAHLRTYGDGSVRSLHVGTYVRGRGWHVAFPLGYGVRSARGWHHGMPAAYVAGPGYWAVPLGLSAGCDNRQGGRTTWITPLFHRSTAGDGRVTSWHVGNVVRFGDTGLLLPLGWTRGSGEQRRTVVLPLYFQGRDHLVVAPWFRFGRGDEAVSGVLPIYLAGKPGWVAPLLMSGRWTTAAGRTTTLLGPLAHRTTGADGRMQHQHLLTYIGTPEASTAFPLYWRWRTDAGGTRRLVLPLWYQHEHGDGSSTRAALPLLAAWRRGHALDTSWGWQLIPFSAQRSADGGEANVLWHLLFHRRRQAGTTEVAAGAVLWWSRQRDGAPMQWQVLTGLLARRRDAASNRMRTYAFWVIPLGSGEPLPAIASAH